MFRTDHEVKPDGCGCIPYSEALFTTSSNIMKPIGLVALLVVACLGGLWLAVAWLLGEELTGPLQGGVAVVNPTSTQIPVRTTAAKSPPPQSATPEIAGAPGAAPVSSPNPPARTLPSASMAIDPFAEGGPKPVVVMQAPAAVRAPGADDERDEVRSGESR